MKQPECINQSTRNPSIVLETYEKIMSRYSSLIFACYQEVTADEKNCTISGYMSCKGLDGKKWKKGWFVIKENVLYEFRESNDTAAQSSMSLLGYEVELLPNSKVHSYEKNLVFQLIHTGQKTILFKAENVDLAQK